MHFQNPILRGDYSDPDVVRVGSDFYLISSSFTYLPGIPVLHSRDLVNWEQVGWAAPFLPFERYDRPAHKCGTWAPSIRYMHGLFYVYVCLPDEGLMAFTAEKPEGPWTPHFVKDVCGWIDPCPLLDDNGDMYLVHGLANSRCGLNNMLFVHRMSADGLQVLDKGRLVYDGQDHGDVTVEGPKMYKRDGWYYIMCPAGGVEIGYQLVLRSRSPYGPYERRVTLSQGSTEVNGPHQGGWVDDGQGHDWFIHFQDRGVYGRIAHLQPVVWKDDWPEMGCAGEPVMEGDTGLTGSVPGCLRMSDDFADGPGIQWQFQANPRQQWLACLKPGIRLFAAPAKTPFEAGQFLSQLMQRECFDMEVALAWHGRPGDAAGLCMMGYGWTHLQLDGEKLRLIQGKVEEIDRFTPDRIEETCLEEVQVPEDFYGNEIRLKMQVRDGMAAYAAWINGSWKVIGEPLPLTKGGWVGARPGIYCAGTRGQWGGHVDVKEVIVTDTENHRI